MLYEQLQPVHQQLLKSFELQLQSNQQLQNQVMQLQYQLHQLTKLLQGFKSERFVPGGTGPQKELGLIFEETFASTKLEDVKKVSYVKVNKPTSKDTVKELPAHLRREEIIIEPDEDVSRCERNGEEVKEQLSWKPGEIFVKRIVRPRYKCPLTGKLQGHRSVIASLPEQALPKCAADPELLAQVTIDKFVDHKPLNRQLDFFKRNGVTIAYSTIADWVRLVAEAIECLGEAQLRVMLRHNYWQGDETGIKVLDSTIKKDTHKGYFWVYMTGDSKLIYYDYHSGRDGPAASHIMHLFKGHLQTDGYAVYEKVAGKDITLLCCLAHARRKVFDAQANDKSRAEYVLTEIAKLYKIEAACKEQQLTEQQIKDKRLKEAVPILQELGEWMKKEYLLLKPKSLIAKALAYSINRWDKLSLYATTGHLNIDNNNIERCMRPVAIGRKNFLFCGSHDAAKRTALLYSLLVTCKLNEVNPYEWLKDMLSYNLQEYPINKIESLLPHNWKLNQENM
ncbi:Transposase [Chitinophaga costaii]|uniref:Transposase n=2 Tax=Chitinophaga costaii TaxID=1335309 RepID=A0A1C4GB71_9BACT|nr:Transposase [Chitinophaga costaii]